MGWAVADSLRQEAHGEAWRKGGGRWEAWTAEGFYRRE